MIIFFIMVAGLNLALGYALALFLAPEYQTAPVAPLPAPQPAPQPAPPARQPAAVAEPQPEPVKTAPAVEEPSDMASLLAELAAAEPVPTVDSGATVATTILDFKQELARYREEVAALDGRMRVGAEAQDAVEMKACLSNLQSANQRYLAQQEAVTNQFLRHCGTDQFAPLGRQLGGAVGLQADQIKASNGQLGALDLESNLLVGCQQLLDEASRLVDANHALRDTLDEVELQVGRQAGLRFNGQQPPADPLNNLNSRVQFEAALAEWWRTDPERLKPLTVGIVDLDRFRDLNEFHGLQVGDRVLDTLTQLVGNSVSGIQLAARMNGQRFLLMFPDLDAAGAGVVLERIRQQIEAMQFDQRGTTVALTASGAVALAQPDDTTLTLLARVEYTLKEAKLAGRNRTLQHDGTIRPVDATKLKIPRQAVSL